MYNLPEHIQALIYSYDNTYHLKFKEVLDEQNDIMCRYCRYRFFYDIVQTYIYMGKDDKEHLKKAEDSLKEKKINMNIYKRIYEEAIKYYNDSNSDSDEEFQSDSEGYDYGVGGSGEEYNSDDD
jgi:hypothetical protein